jgi:hypothetical protein
MPITLDRTQLRGAIESLRDSINSKPGQENCAVSRPERFERDVGMAALFSTLATSHATLGLKLGEVDGGKSIKYV